MVSSDAPLGLATPDTPYPSGQANPELAIVIPALNESHNLSFLLPAIREVIGDSIAYELVVVDSGSQDLTPEVAQRYGARVVRSDLPRYGSAILTGIRETAAPWIMTMDANLSHRPEFLLALWESRRQADFVIGSRYAAGGEARMPLVRSLFSRALNRTFRNLLSVPVRDLSSGMRMYRRDVLEGMPIVARDFDLLPELLVRAYAEGWQVAEVPFQYEHRSRHSSWRRLTRLAWCYLRTLHRMWRLRNSVQAADYDYRAFYSRIWLQRYWQRARHRIVLGFLEQQESVLDIGCGSSRIILDLPKAVGLDILQRKLRWLRPRHDYLVRASCDRLPFADESFEAVICSEVIEHVPDTPEVLQEMGRVLKPGGVLILGTPDYGRWLWWVLEWIYGLVLPGAYAQEHITHFTYRSLHERLVAAGYEVLDHAYVGYCELIFKARKPAA
jgi:dolichol-phosphate mannosyltransferase